MIVRIMTEGQFSLRGAHLDRLNRLDNRVVAAVEAGNEARFRKAYTQLLEFVHQRGEPVAATELVESDIVLPEPDLTLAEARHLFVGEGLVPD